MSESEAFGRRLADLEQRVSLLEARVGKTPGIELLQQKPMSIREFLNSVGPSNDLEKTLAIGLYLEKFEKVESFNIADLREAFSRAKEPRPANLNDAVNKNIQKGLLMEANERKGGTKAWIVTNSGENFVGQRISRSEGKAA